MAGPLSALAGDLGAAFEDSDGLGHAAGAAAKAVALEEIGRDLGSDRAFSGFRRAVELRAGYDIRPGRVDLNLYPEGLWTLAREGRRAKGRKVIPRPARRRRRRGHRPAVLTPAGWRYSARITASRPAHNVARFEARLEADVGDAIDDHVFAELGSL